MRAPLDLREERGAATVWTLALLGVVLMVGAVSSAVAVQAIVRQQAATAADVAAIAGAQAIDDACGAASTSADANGVALVACSMDGADIVVTVRRPAPEFVRRVLALVGGSATDVSASSRAGPP